MGDETPKQRREPTASEAMFFFAIVKHTRNKADIDWDAVAQEQNFKNAEVAKVRFGQVKRKLGIDLSATPKKGNTSSAASTPSKVRKTPSGRAGAKGRGRGGRVKKEEEAEAEADVEANAEAGDETTAVESSPIKGEDDSIDFKLEDHEDPF
ncbi:hypothetical protein Trco_000251 [Trichoderma cornu-damae]|uniref:Myb-like DNA-binding domain-containing protein n=1 Tax=Trichoderma cornu-damae TaxID=654480 RepID=A0A9P8QS01_9HYPO|nr:hypothetical protein Trco_000251 [Trichoderma cornu-damae]